MFWNQPLGAGSAEAAIIDVNSLPASPKNAIYRTPGGQEEIDFATYTLEYDSEKSDSDYISELVDHGFKNTSGTLTPDDKIIKYNNKDIASLTISSAVISITYKDHTTGTVTLSSTDFVYSYCPLYNYYAGDETTNGYSRIMDKDFFDKINDTAVYSGDEEGTSEILAESTFDAVCKTASATAAKVASSENYILRSGNRFSLAITNGNSAASAITLNVNGTGAKAIYINGEASSATNYTLPAGTYSVLYDGTQYQIRTDGDIPGVSGEFEEYKESIAYLDDEETTTAVNDYTVDAVCTTAGNVADKIAFCDGYVLTSGNRFSLLIANANSYQGALTLNVNGTGAKPIYLNGSVSSSSNYTLSAGLYSIVYDGTNYQIRTDGDIPTITGSVKADVNLVNKCGAKRRIVSTKTSVKTSLKTWVPKNMPGLPRFVSGNIWTDGDNIYYSEYEFQYVFDKKTLSWTPKTWNGLTNFYGGYVWTDGNNIYYSYETTHYVLNKETSTWSAKTWSGLTSFYADRIWTDGDNIYYSFGTTQYVLNPTTSTWSTKSWSGLTNFYGHAVWTDGSNIYYSDNSTQYVLNKSNSTWSSKTWTGLTNFIGSSIWSDGSNIYYTYGNSQYILNKETSYWDIKIWNGVSSLYADEIWTDGENIYCSKSSDQEAIHYMLTTKYNDHGIISSDDINNIEGQISTLNSELTSKLNWMPFGNHNIGNYQPQSNFPSSWSEMLFVFKYSTILLEVHLPKNVVDAYSGTDPDAMYNGFYYTPTINAGVVVTYNKTKFSAYGFYYNGASVASSATCTAYYR